jgi:hypothetical protein
MALNKKAFINPLSVALDTLIEKYIAIQNEKILTDPKEFRKVWLKEVKTGLPLVGRVMPKHWADKVPEPVKEAWQGIFDTSWNDMVTDLINLRNEYKGVEKPGKVFRISRAVNVGAGVVGLNPLAQNPLLFALKLANEKASSTSKSYLATVAAKAVWEKPKDKATLGLVTGAEVIDPLGAQVLKNLKELKAEGRTTVHFPVRFLIGVQASGKLREIYTDPKLLMGKRFAAGVSALFTLAHRKGLINLTKGPKKAWLIEVKKPELLDELVNTGIDELHTMLKKKVIQTFNPKKNPTPLDAIAHAHATGLITNNRLIKALSELPEMASLAKEVMKKMKKP